MPTTDKAWRYQGPPLAARHHCGDVEDQAIHQEAAEDRVSAVFACATLVSSSLARPQAVVSAEPTPKSVNPRSINAAGSPARIRRHAETRRVAANTTRTTQRDR